MKWFPLFIYRLLKKKTLAQQLAGIIYPAFVCYAICRLVRLNFFFYVNLLFTFLGYLDYKLANVQLERELHSFSEIQRYTFNHVANDVQPLLYMH